MRCGFSVFCLILCVSLFSQEKLIPHLIAEKGEIELIEQTAKITIVGEKTDVFLQQNFKISETSIAYYLFPVKMNSTLYELSVEYKGNYYYLDAQNMNRVRNQVNAENKKGKKINLTHSENSSYIQLELPEIIQNDEFKISVRYIQTIQKDQNLKIFQLPGLVTENYSKKPEDFSISIDLASSIPIQNSKINLQNTDFNLVSAKHHNVEITKFPIDRNVKISFETQNSEIQAGMLVYEEKGCRYILGSVEPPKEIDKKNIAPREYIFVMDVSGSMLGFPIEISKELIMRVVNDLNSDEKFNILFFAGTSDFFAEKSVYATPENKEAVKEILSQQRGKGNTELSEALQQIYRYKPKPEYNRIVVLITDGMLNTSNLMIRDLRTNLPDAQYFIFGIGYEIGRKNLQLLASVTGTKAILVNDQKQAKAEADRFFEWIQSPVLRYIKISSKELNLNETYPQQYNGFLSGQSSQFITKECSRNRNPKLILTGINGEEIYEKEYGLTAELHNEDLLILKYLWSIEKIDYLLQEEERCGSRCIQSGKYRNEIIKIGEELNISTPYTSFVEINRLKDGRTIPSYAITESSVSFQNDFDSDFDGVPNTLDECPFDKGNINRKGCPNTKEENITLEINRMMEGIEFEFDSYEIQPQFYEKLNTAAAIILETDLIYEVEGHTDAAGTPQYNLNLSIQRAQAVADYLKTKGIPENRMKITGKGDTELRHPECRPQEICDDQKNFENRRVIFKLMK
ncbi:MAG: OmpA family protein [Weeksellaceae bacterium]|jgi:Ca-activated chloride channel family protein|nr:OmpA family protein [Weeksellaceae bacterium]